MNLQPGRPPGDVDPLVWGAAGAVALGGMTMLVLLVSGHVTDRGFLLVFLLPALAVIVVWMGRLLRAQGPDGTDRAGDGGRLHHGPGRSGTDGD